MGLINCYGLKGSGKNTFIVELLRKSKRPIYSNFNIRLPNYHKLEIKNLLDLSNDCEVVMDEAYSWIESRQSSKYLNLFLSYISFQLRKTNRNLFVSAQDPMSIDKRYRNLWDWIVFCSRKYDKHKHWTKWDFKYYIYWRYSSGCSIQILPFNYCIKSGLFDLFDTDEIIECPAKDRILYEILKTNEVGLRNESFKAASQIKPFINMNYVTKDSVRFGLLMAGRSEVWANNVYIIYKNYISKNRPKGVKSGY